MMSNQDRIRATFQDLTNVEAVNLVYTAHNTGATPLSDYWHLLIPLTSCNLVMVQQDSSVVGPDPGAGAAGDYPTCSDMATLEFQAADGRPWPITWPGVTAACLKPDHITIDPGQADVASMIVWCLANATTKDGTILVEYVRGWRWELEP